MPEARDRARSERTLGGELRSGLLGLARAAAGGASALARRELDPDRLLVRTMAAHIEYAATRYAVDAGARWRPGEPLRLLLAGYSGVRNTGADVRVEEIIRQLRHLLGDEHLALSILTIDPAGSRGYFRTVRQLHLPQFFPPFLAAEVHRQHGVIACEGSMFKSKFASALSTMMVGALGLAAVENKIAVGYGGEAGAMDAALRELVREHCRKALVIVRNQESAAVLAELGVPSRPGTDTAWTFEPAPPEVGERMLREAGWDGRAPLIVACPINPFWWPVKPDVVKGAVHALTGAHAEAHYDSFYFHREGADVARAQARYVAALGDGIARVARRAGAFVALVGMEALDRRACVALADDLEVRLGARPPMFVSDEHDMYAMVSLLRRASALLSSRYHAIVTSMPGLVPSAGVTMDERIRNLMKDRGQSHLCLEVDQADLGDRVAQALEELLRDGPGVADGIGRCVVANLERMGRMGAYFVDHLRARHPELPLRPELGTEASGGRGDAWAHLPPLPPEVAALVRRYRAGSADAAPRLTRPVVAQATAEGA